ncbi:class I SAM-dependent methyltransferase [Methanomethylophilus alvi]|uniref:class I SAM-dependent methyltransferase n=1 Tax=Methanomethylophilus alvi TaxID=1291540 RepID=UPI0037DD7C5B
MDRIMEHRSKPTVESIGFSEDRLKDAYGRMDVENHPWARHASKEIESLESLCSTFIGKRIMDAGCGRGRHSLSIAKKYPSSSILGVDYSEANISSALSKKDGLTNVEFEVSDLRDYRPDRTFDIVLCLYDVIGSFPDDSDNEAIVETLASCCEIGGYLAVSVMNMERRDIWHILPTYVMSSQTPRSFSIFPRGMSCTKAATSSIPISI